MFYDHGSIDIPRYSETIGIYVTQNDSGHTAIPKPFSKVSSTGGTNLSCHEMLKNGHMIQQLLILL